MAHGNASDLAFFGCLAIVVQLLALPDALYGQLGPFKAQFTDSKSPDLEALTKLLAGLFLTIGFAFSSVKWNPLNGKMAGVGGFIASVVVVNTQFAADGSFIPKLFYAYIAVLLIGSVHICVFPSNPLVKTLDPENTKDNHGNMSDLVALALLASSLAAFFYPDHLYMDLGPIKPQFTTKSSDMTLMIRFTAGLMLMWALMLSGVKWNPLNGKGAGLGGFICAGLVAYSTFAADSMAFVPRMFYVYAAMIFLSALHIFVFPSNLLPPKKASDEKKTE